MSDPDELRLDYVLVADAGEVVGGKLYLLGGGWDRLLVPHLPGPPGAPFAVAVSISVPWNMTNKKLRLIIDVVDADGGDVSEIAQGEFEVGRPPGMRPGVSQRLQVAVPAQPQFTTEGRYVVRCSIDAAVLGSTAIEVAAATPAPAAA